MTKTIGWILLTVMNLVFVAVSVFALADNLERGVSPIVPICFIVFFLAFAYLWGQSARTEWKEWQKYIKEDE